MIVLHGDNTAQSRVRLYDLVAELEKKGKEVAKCSGSELTSDELEQNVGSTDLFGNSKAVVIEKLFSLPVSKKNQALINTSNKYQD